jgi:hypothetical protein
MEPKKISRDGVYKLIKNMNPSKATGPDTIAGRVLKENVDICTDILTLLFTKSLETGKVPSDWNYANVTPVFKKGDKHNPGNYRPISITCIACKLLEHIFVSNMMQHLETNNILYELQHGFRAKRSCESQIISLIHELSQNNDKNIHTDLINNNGLCKSFQQGTTQKDKMKYFGISEQIINWVKSFLSSRILNSTFRKYDIIKNTSHIWCPTVQFLDQYFF